MKKTVKMLLKTGLALLLMAGLITGCTSSTDIPVTEQNEVTEVVEVEETTEVTPEAETDVETEVESETDDTTECPEGYVYDYQVSMEPIPVEIAELGGPCQGTIHAFPSKIGMALTELEMEKDPVLKEEVEKRIPEIEAALEEEIGGDFTVDGVILNNDLSWEFFCTENETGYQFDLAYANYDYYAKKNDKPELGNYVSVNNYFDEKDSLILRNDLTTQIKEIYKESDVKIRMQTEGDDVDMVIASYSNTEIDKVAEQKRLLQLWEILNNYDSDRYYNICIIFFTTEYQGLIEQKFTSTCRYDFGRFFSEKVIMCMEESKDIWCCINYYEEDMEVENYNLDILLQQYKTGEWQEEIIEEYWIS